MGRSLVALLACLTAVVPAAAGMVSTGLRGQVMRGPTTPVCRVGMPCSAPAKHVRITFVRNGVAKSVVTGDTGRYAIELAAGTYGVRLPSAQFGFRPHSAFVTAGRMSIRNFSIDTGIR